MNCPRCGATNPEGFRFCGSCGAHLTAATGREIRKTVTVLFADVTGSTAIGERLDPESLRHVMGRYFDEMRAVIERHGGIAEKFIGDAIMAVFGIPVLHEDDARRALHAASDMRERLSLLNTELERDFGVRIEARIGVNTGEVVTGDESSGQRLATGDAVNVAARLEQAASPGEILLGEQTLTLARDAVEVAAVEPLQLKGKTDRIPAYRLVSVIEGAPAFDRRFDVPLVGRRDELGRVRDAFEGTLEDRKCRLVTVIGPPGIGKTRLAREVAADVGGSALVLAGRCLPYGEGITYWPLREIFAGAGAENELDAALGAGAPEEIFYAVRKAIEARARHRPLLLVVEDIHWAEPTLLDLLEHLADWTRDAQLLLLCLARPELLDTRPGWAGRANADILTLEPLPETETNELIAHLLGGAQLDVDTRTRVRRTAEGNPLFVEQLLAMLTGGGDPDRVPPTIQALLSARLDSLPDEQRELLERASVVGLEFEWEALTSLAPDGRRPSGASLMALVRKDLIRPHETIGDTFLFRHILIRDAAYARVSKELRSGYHERFADWLDGRAEEFDEIIGYHLEQAHRLMLELGPSDERARALAERAVERLLPSAMRANARGDFPGAANLLERVAALLPQGDETRLALLPLLGRTLFETGRTDRSKEILEEAVAAARQAGEDAIGAEASVELAYVRILKGGLPHEDVRNDIEQAIRLFEDRGDLSRVARALSIAGTVAYWQGKPSAVPDLERAARLAFVVGDRAQVSLALQYVFLHHAWGPTPVDEALERITEMGRHSGGNRIIQGNVLRARALLEAMRGDFDLARRLVAEANSLAEEIGLERFIASTHRFSGNIEDLAGDPVGAEREFRTYCRLLERMGQWGYYISGAWRLAEVLSEQGRDDEASSLIDLVDGYSVPEDLDAELGRRTARAMVLARRGDLVTAERLAREAGGLARGTTFSDLEAHTLAVLGEVLRLAGRHDESAAAINEAIELYRAKGNVAMIAKLEREREPM